MEQLRYLLGVATLALVGFAAWVTFDLLAADELEGFAHVRLEFEDVRGLKPGADVRYRGVDVGDVFDVRVSDGGEKALVEIAIREDAAHLACSNSRFWIVSPRFHGLTGGATGLDTLVRDAYLTFLTPTPRGPLLTEGVSVAGLERPYADPESVGLEPIRHGDLRMFVHANETHGLTAGSRVVYRGIDTGEVRRIDLAEDGTRVVLTLRIARAHRRTVNDASAFWVARPRVSGALIGGVSVDDLEALLAPFVAYGNGPRPGLPVPDDYRVVARDTRPDLEASDLELPAAPEATAVESAQPGGIALVHVDYEAVESDWLSADEREQRAAVGVLFADASGRTLVATPRSACDAAWFMTDTLGSEPDITREAIRVTISGGAVLRASRAWIEPGGRDLALLLVDDAPSDLPVATLAQFDFGADAVTAGTFELRGTVEPAIEATPDALPPVADHRGRAALRSGLVMALLGQGGPHDQTPALIPLSLLPAELRPRR